jgi:hypothetical protein
MGCFIRYDTTFAIEKALNMFYDLIKIVVVTIFVMIQLNVSATNRYFIRLSYSEWRNSIPNWNRHSPFARCDVSGAQWPATLE